MSDNPLLKTPGEMISEARQAQDLTIAQLSERTKIPPGVLASLELDEFHKISGPLYIKSFLRTCAVDLGLDPQIVLSLYNQISGENKSRPVGSEMVWAEEEVQVSRVGLPWLRIILAAGVLAVVIGIGLFTLRGCGTGESTRDDGSHPGVGQTEPGETAVLIVQSDSVAGGESRHESLMTTSTEEELRQMAAVVEEATDEPVEVPVPEKEMVVGDPVQDGDEVLPEESSTEGPLVEIVEETPAESTSTSQEIEQEMIVIEGPRKADPVVAQMDSSWPLVLSISCDAPQGILVKRDGDREFSGVRWPQEPEDAPILPDAGFEAGRAYRHGDRLVVFWGAEDHFSVKLSRVRGIEVAINGIVWNDGSLTAGQEYILDEHSVTAKPRP